MNTICAIVASGMLYCGPAAGDFRPVNDIVKPQGFSRAQVYVDGYTRQNGTYVAPYERGLPDGNCANNRRGC